MPLVGVGAHRGDHLGKICLGVRKAHVTRRTRDIVEHKGLVAAIQKCKRHRVLLVRSDMCNPPPPQMITAGRRPFGLSGNGSAPKYVNVAG